MDKENRRLDELREEINWTFSDYSFDIEIEEIDSYCESDEKAWTVKISPKYSPDITFTIHVEFMDGVFKFEHSEDNYEEINQERLFQFMFFEALTMVKRLKPDGK